MIDDLPADQSTCTVAPSPEAKDQFLHQVLCGLHDDQVHKILLTPNYSADHRNHFQVDLTPRVGSSVRRTGAAFLDDGVEDE